MLDESYHELQNSEPQCQGSAFIWTTFSHVATKPLCHWLSVRGARTSFTTLTLGHVTHFLSLKIHWLQGTTIEVQNPIFH